MLQSLSRQTCRRQQKPQMSLIPQTTRAHINKNFEKVDHKTTLEIFFSGHEKQLSTSFTNKLAQPTTTTSTPPTNNTSQKHQQHMPSASQSNSRHQSNIYIQASTTSQHSHKQSGHEDMETDRRPKITNFLQRKIKHSFYKFQTLKN